MKSGRAPEIAYFVLRVAVGFLFMQHGGQKILGWFGGAARPIEPWSQAWIGGWLELVLGVLVAAGLFTRVAAFLASGEMAVAFFQFHFKQDAIFPIENRGVPATLYAFIFLYIAAVGGGPWSLDALFFGRRRGEAEPLADRDRGSERGF